MLRRLKAHYPEWLRPKDVQIGDRSSFWILRKLLAYGLIERRHGESERNFEYRLKSGR